MKNTSGTCSLNHVSTMFALKCIVKATERISPFHNITGIITSFFAAAMHDLLRVNFSVLYAKMPFSTLCTDRLSKSSPTADFAAANILLSQESDLTFEVGKR